MLYLSQAIGRPVLDANDDPLGKVDDLIVAVGDSHPSTCRARLQQACPDCSEQELDRGASR